MSTHKKQSENAYKKGYEKGVDKGLEKYMEDWRGEKGKYFDMGYKKALDEVNNIIESMFDLSKTVEAWKWNEPLESLKERMKKLRGEK